ncbi:hypothetical protein MVEN_01884800 [Mycena venus]|uniref:DUF6534 domain-containing protein n=1 Tax=Mycena venus TaxID=2733690 RepID=A0A8H6XH90_9AGAR|nr:hypothetical protein MVEN_01884800 [Mycena venus]
MVDVASTLGALLVGGAVALVLSGIVSVQCIIFYKLYPNEIRIRKLMVVAVWYAHSASSPLLVHLRPGIRRLLDLLHSAFIVASLFDYFIHFFGNTDRIGYIPSSIALSVVVTAMQTMIAHWYFAHKIYKSSERNWWITGPIVLLAFLRLLAASVSTTEMIRLHAYAVFNHKYPGWIFTTGLSLSAAVDIIITVCLCYFLQKMRRRTASNPMARVVNTPHAVHTRERVPDLVRILSFVTTTASLICWLRMPDNLVFLGLHFVIGKLYANSLLISLNTRKELREMRWNKTEWDPAVPVLSADDFTVPYSQTYTYGAATSLTMSSPTAAYRPAFKVNPRVLPSQLEISVERRIERTSDDLSDIIRQDNVYQRYQRPRSPRHTSEHLRSLP